MDVYVFYWLSPGCGIEEFLGRLGLLINQAADVAE